MATLEFSLDKANPATVLYSSLISLVKRKLKSSMSENFLLEWPLHSNASQNVVHFSLSPLNDNSKFGNFTEILVEISFFACFS